MAIWVQKTTSEWQIRVCSFSCKLLEGHLQMIADDCLCSGFEKLQIGGRRLETAAGYLYNLFSLTYSLRLINQRRWCLGLRLRIHDHWRWRRSNHFKRQNSHTTDKLIFGLAEREQANCSFGFGGHKTAAVYQKGGWGYQSEYQKYWSTLCWVAAFDCVRLVRKCGGLLDFESERTLDPVCSGGLIVLQQAVGRLTVAYFK